MYSSNTNGPLWRDDSGAGTAWWILWMIVFMVFGGVAVDSANAWLSMAPEFPAIWAPEHPAS